MYLSGSYINSENFIRINQIVLAIIFLFVSNCLAETNNVIIAFGDSITVGAWENSAMYGNGLRIGGYEPDLETLFDNKGNHHDVLNYGHAGEYTMEQPSDKGGFRRLVEDVLPNHPNAKYVLILEGTNDYWTGLSRNTTVAMLGLMVDACLEYGIEPILATLTPDMTATWGAAKNIPAYNELIMSLSEEKKVKLVDTYTPMVDEWKSKYAYADYKGSWYIDYTHLSREGYNKLAELWFEKISTNSLPWLNLLLSGN